MLKWTKFDFRPQIPLGELTALLQAALLYLRGLTSKGVGIGGEKMEAEGPAPPNNILA